MRAPRVAAFVLALGAAGCFFPDDEAVIRETFNVPREAVRREMDVSPKTSGWFGREDLGIHATFELSEPAAKEFLARVAVAPVWRPTPPSRDLLAKIGGVGRSVEGNRRNAGSRALFACKTAGDDIMRKKKVECADCPGDQNDWMFAVFDPDARTLRVAVHTSY